MACKWQVLLLCAVANAGIFDHDAEEARWIVHAANWGYMSTLDSKTAEPTASVASFSDGLLNSSTGRLFFYLMTADPGRDGSNFSAALTLSEAVLDPADYTASQCGSRAGVDPEDPRCAKITISGVVSPCTGDSIKIGQAALFDRHPQMKDWPKDHGFSVFEMIISDIWMISSYGGGAKIKPSDYYHAKPKHHPESGAKEEISTSYGPGTSTPPPAWNQTAARARWLVYNSLWTTISTVSVMLNGRPWGNVRSIADGVGANSSGLPFLYVNPKPPNKHHTPITYL
jgi:hypothetical protein